jgi:hypothetical protein
MNLYRLVFDFRETNQAIITATGVDEATVIKHATAALVDQNPDITDVQFRDIELIGQVADDGKIPTNEGSERLN